MWSNIWIRRISTVAGICIVLAEAAARWVTNSRRLACPAIDVLLAPFLRPAMVLEGLAFAALVAALIMRKICFDWLAIALAIVMGAGIVVFRVGYFTETRGTAALADECEHSSALCSEYRARWGDDRPATEFRRIALHGRCEVLFVEYRQRRLTRPEFTARELYRNRTDFDGGSERDALSTLNED